MAQASHSRRSFLATTAAACGAATLGPVAAAKEPLPLTLGIQLYSLRGFPVAQALDHAKALGLKQVEFYPGMFPISDDAAAIAAMKQQVADRGLTISAHGVNRFTKDAADNRRLFEFAKAAGIKTITADPDPDSFASLDELVKEFDIRVLAAIEKHDERIGACADLGHFIRSGERPTEVIRLLKGRLYGIHLKDFAEMQAKTKGVILGQGHLDVPAVMEALVAVGFPADGALSIEYEENPKDPIAELQQCVAVARAALGQA